MSSSHNRNPTGRNQHPPVPGIDDPRLVAALEKYHREGISSNEVIRERLFAELTLTMSKETVKRRRKELGLLGSRSKRSTLSDKEMEQIVLQQLDKDPAKGQGIATIKSGIAYDQGIHLKRDFISGVMHIHDADAFLARAPGASSIERFDKVPLGIHERWSCDGHDKLYRIGFPVWAIVDDATGRWLGAWVVPSNRMAEIIGFLFLKAVEAYRGLPLQTTTDCGSETTQFYGLSNALRQIFFPEYDLNDLPAHCYLRSVHNISIERSWLRLRLELGNNAVLEYEKGAESGVFRPEDELHFLLSRWLWSRVLQQEIDSFMAKRNAKRTRKNNKKAGPSGCSPNDAFCLPEQHGLKNLLLPLTDEQLAVVAEIKDAMGEQEDQIPRSILSLPGVAALLLEQANTDTSDAGFGLTDDASAVLASAQQFQAKASDLRLGKKPSVNRNPDTAGLNKFKNLAKARQVVAERKAKRDEVNLVGIGNGIKVSATLWSITEGQNKMVQIAGIRVAQVFGPDKPTQSALDVLLQSVQKTFSDRHPDAELLTWPLISLYAHETQQKYVSLDYFERERPMSQFFNEFLKGKLAADNMLKDKKIEIRFVFFTDQVFHDRQNLNESSCLPSGRSKASSRLLTASAFISKSKRPKIVEEALASAIASSNQSISMRGKSFEFAIPSIPASRPTPILRSAFRPPIPSFSWTRDVSMVTCTFLRMAASYTPTNGLRVDFETSEEIEEIEIAAKWEKADEPGYIGEGFTKRGIYARFKGREYVVTQPIDLCMTDESVLQVLKAEYSLLCIGDTLKREFDQYAKECSVVSIPKFYFNFKESILGRLRPSLSSESRHLPHSFFIATPLLRCGNLDSKIKKFTGNDEFGEAHDHLTKAIHAFTHFTAVYTHESLVLCDLQGLYDSQKIMCLIDPQAHTATKQDNTCHEYWDRGPEMLKSFLRKHEPACRDNWICQALNLSDAIVEKKGGSPLKANSEAQLEMQDSLSFSSAQNDADVDKSTSCLSPTLSSATSKVIVAPSLTPSPRGLSAAAESIPNENIEALWHKASEDASKATGAST
ncbi:hypothetical protein CVT26_016028 [Gymnopilus dilepis]|uniref:Alpha-type protein kinase domain-containing protein n=1 Tax=Gymnopilus dilepis TaxID=231916 RepID=A0A409WMB7_9AGAR|nr:hypothetical protein CVT26_016028 [Gymnopilus dilepis]